MKWAILPIIALIGTLIGLPSAWAQGEASTADPGIVNPLSRLGPDALDDFLAKPLFVPSRTAPVKIDETASAVAIGVPAITPPRIQVVGIIETPKEKVAQVIDLATEARYSIRQGDFIGDWAVSSIDRRSITMRLDDREETFKVESNAISAEPAAPAGAAVAKPAANQPEKAPSEADRVGFFGAARGK